MSASREPHPLTTPQRLYLWLTAIFVTCLLTADLIGSKLFSVSLLGLDVVHSVAMIPFPVTFLLTDLLNEYYGKAAARRVVMVGFAAAGLCFVFLLVGDLMPIASISPITQDQYDAVFGNARLMYVASLTAYLAGSLLDIALFARLKGLTKGRFLWLRATGSTVVSQMLDSLVVTTIFWSNQPALGDGSPVTPQAILKLAATGYALKFFIALGLTPLIYGSHRLVHRWFGLKPLPPEGPAAP
jgi:uncharacterized integral membrane protein (TIGR00697 family)